MPELPEVETVRTGLEQAIKGAAIRKVTLRRGDLRVPFPKGLAEALAGRRIASIGRRAKYLLFYLDSGDALIVHLGMTGRFLVEKKPPVLGKHDHVVFSLADGRWLIFNDARRFGLMTLAKKSDLEAHPLLAGLGPEPFDRGFSPKYLENALAARKGPVKPVLMDQQLVVGVGNIYASEALFRAGIDPRQPAHKAAGKAKEIVAAIRQVLKDAIASGGSSLRDFLHITGYSGDFQHRFQVYGRKGKPCFACLTPIRMLRQAGRSTFFCPKCQK
ncbi:MAG: bifunctional DNA-formamidopyrimidine glycosylase/DNA-(apurinic or apyrimidinic site) lyase [Pseudomonadota bacterium]|nr:bifunctional DNA-formamidopyrimidine glycosylase/DNA-(apurinic or apyrimidinic site) lyase [Pseudomonadota bacterium]